MGNIDPRSVDLTGMLDIHMHAEPDVVKRSGNDLDMARDAAAAGMRAIVLKCHHAPTAGRAALCSVVMAGGCRVFGGVALNQAVGGLNPKAVETALKMGGHVVWMPTLGARHHRRLREGKDDGLTIFDESGRILGSVVEILDQVARAGAVLSSGHLAPEETLALFRLARERHVEKMVALHPEYPGVAMTTDQQREAARLGALVERDYVNTLSRGERPVPLESIAADIRAVGVETTILATDVGQIDAPRPVVAMGAYLAGLSALGFSDRELRTMASDNPARLLGL